jgi:hypothetical protein
MIALPQDLPGRFSFNPDYVEPRTSCKDCGEWLIAGGCDNCAEALRESLAAQFQEMQGSQHGVSVTADRLSIHAAKNVKADSGLLLNSIEQVTR